MKLNRTPWPFLFLILILLPNLVAFQAQEADSKEAADWDVQNPPGTWQEVSIDTREGTWLSLDVSPDGQEIVFDLLGDLYSIPISGGEARRLTDGIAWDMQPRFSPDGKSIAFTSDRGGGDNLWIMDRDGGNPRALTKETFRLLNSPAWSPDGLSIAARKHFTSSRSLGAGEIWLYHVGGGDGLQMTRRPNDQKDVGEPAFSRDGRYVYFSQDTTPGSTFEYNKDSNAGIYEIRRLDRESGEVTSLISGPGGAIRPTPSPDGKLLAFVRRVRFRSVLFLRELSSGAEWPIYDELERDMQETWAVHGVYPAFAWTPDSRSLVFWSRGKIRRLEAGGGAAREIPFHVSDTRRVAAAVRRPVAVAPDQFDVRMLRWVRVSPDGTRVLYQALGRLYVRALPDGEPRRLTAQTDHFELFPSFSRDGRWVVYVSWDDEQLGAVRIAPAGGGEGRIVTSEKGHYVEPVFSPDGATIVYRKVGGGFLTSPTWSNDPGIYRVDSSGGPSTRITGSGVEPQFGAGNDRVYLSTVSGDKKQLISLELTGAERREHFESEHATSFRVSGDGKWIAFTEKFNAYIAPFVPTGQKQDLGPGTRTIPVRQVSRDAGEYLHWSGDNQSLYWSLGSQLFERNLGEAFRFLPGAPAELPDPPEQGREIGFRADADRPSGRVAFRNARIITMEGDEVIEGGTLLVDGNRVLGVGRNLAVPEGTHVIDATGKTIMPGLIDVHAHGSQGVNEIIPEQNWMLLAGLAFGVTTIHDPSNDTATIFAASEMGRAGLITAPRIFSTGTILYGATTDFTAEVDRLDDARSHLRRMKAVGAFSVKSYNQPRRDQRQQILEAARELEMLVVPEGGSLVEHNMTMVVDGHTGIEHSIPVENVYADLRQLWSQTEVGYTPTLIVGYGGIWGENYWYEQTNVWENRRLLNFVPREQVDPRSRRRLVVPEEEWNHFNNARVCKELLDAGVQIQLGAHGQREGLGAHWELWMFVQGGMTPLEAIRTATLAGASYLGMDGDLGSLKEGKLADFVVLDSNPLENIRHSEDIRYTVVNGRVYDAMSMSQVGNHPETRPPLFWKWDRGVPPAQ